MANLKPSFICLTPSSKKLAICCFLKVEDHNTQQFKRSEKNTFALVIPHLYFSKICETITATETNNNKYRAKITILCDVSLQEFWIYFFLLSSKILFSCVIPIHKQSALQFPNKPYKTFNIFPYQKGRFI